ncbi:hypothetical protein PSPO01_10709 [Paraphaeosphaeria sporulosa]
MCQKRCNTTVMLSSLTPKRLWPKRADSGSMERGPLKRAPDIDASMKSSNYTVHTVLFEKVKRDKLCAQSGEKLYHKLKKYIITVSEMQEISVFCKCFTSGKCRKRRTRAGTHRRSKVNSAELARDLSDEGKGEVRLLCATHRPCAGSILEGDLDKDRLRET